MTDKRADLYTIKVAEEQMQDEARFRKAAESKGKYLFSAGKLKGDIMLSVLYWNKVMNMSMIKTYNLMGYELKDIITMIHGIDKVNGAHLNYMAHCIVIPLERTLIENVSMKAVFIGHVNSMAIRHTNLFYLDENEQLQPFDDDEMEHVHPLYYQTITAPNIGLYVN